MNECRFKVPRQPWHLPFLAEPEELRGVRNVMRLHLGVWGLPHMIDAAQLCMTELVTNVIKHVGRGTPTTLAVSMRGGSLRLEVTDPDARALPTLLAATEGDESGRGMALVDAVATRWGVVLRADSKVTWCELATGLRSADDHLEGPAIERAESLLALYSLGRQPDTLETMLAGEEAAIDVITDLLHWIRGHGLNPTKVLDHACLHFDVECHPGH